MKTNVCRSLFLALITQFFLFGQSFAAESGENTVVTITTNRGTFSIELFDNDTPVTVQNFLNYVNRGDYNGSFLHRSIPGFILQGGGFIFNEATGDAESIDADAPIINEFQRSNLRGTVAMAKLSGNPDSATNQWFVNLANNASNLDNQNGGFTVFGQVIGDGMTVVDDIASLPVNNFGGAFSDLPTINYISGSIAAENFVTLSDVSVDTSGDDTDGDGTPDATDDDDDNDGVLDTVDVFPFDSAETLDTDNDGIGNNADADDDGDGVLDTVDIFPLDSAETLDTDTDGIGNNADTDDDGDGVLDTVDAFPLDSAEIQDIDGDGIGNNADADDDGDGVDDDQDAFPEDGTEISDSDNDGTGDVADSDDDNDGLPDSFELANGLNPIVDDAIDDLDGDGISNLLEFQSETNPNDSSDFDNCVNSAISGDLAENSAFTNARRISFANPGSNSQQQTLLRFVNQSVASAEVELYGIDDSGVASRLGPVSFELVAGESKQITVQDLEEGNAGKGLSNTLCDGTGKWQLIARSSGIVEVINLIRTPDGFLTNLSSVVPVEQSQNVIYFANPGSNSNQQTFIRIANLSSNAGLVTISGVDDAGASSNSEVSFTLMGDTSLQLTAQDLENGNQSKGLTGQLGDGTGKWRLTVDSSIDLSVASLIRTPDGFLTNLSSVVESTDGTVTNIDFATPASDSGKTTFLRLVNITNENATVTISGTDDTGNGAPGGTVMIEIAANSAVQVTSDDLENGNLTKGVLGGLSNASGLWQLELQSNVAIKVQNLVRTPDGFLTNLSSTSPVSTGVNEVLVFNPGSNLNQRSSLRIVNRADQMAEVSINAVDDKAASAPGGGVTLQLLPGAGILLSAEDLENGNAELGLVGALGDGVGKWRLSVSADVEISVQSLLDTPTGFLTNLSQPVTGN
jgi:cyclophilin family peptidyl-prolyl cis-trans isomerase